MRIILILSLFLMGCTATAKNFKLDKETGKMECVQIITLDGIGNRDAKFEDKSEIKNDSGLRVPNLKIDVDSLTD